MPIPDTLDQKIELFRETGRVFRKNEELFAENSWVQVMMGQGIMPRAYHPIATKLSDDELGRLLQTIRAGVAQTVAGLPDASGLCRALLRRARRRTPPECGVDGGLIAWGGAGRRSRSGMSRPMRACRCRPSAGSSTTEPNVRPR